VVPGGGSSGVVRKEGRERPRGSNKKKSREVIRLPGETPIKMKEKSDKEKGGAPGLCTGDALGKIGSSVSAEARLPN